MLKDESMKPVKVQIIRRYFTSKKYQNKKDPTYIYYNLTNKLNEEIDSVIGIMQFEVMDSFTYLPKGIKLGET
jgi:hypothetical protein